MVNRRVKPIKESRAEIRDGCKPQMESDLL